MNSADPDEPLVHKLAFEYAWGYFSLHAGQRMQSVNFFLLAASFLVAAYVSAITGQHPGLAAGISLVGASSSFVFYRIERRVRGLLQAAEHALHPMEQIMADSTNNPALLILKSVDQAAPGAWPYSKVFRILYFVVGLGFLAAAIYAVISQVGLTPNTTTLYPTVLKLASGVILLLFAVETFADGAIARFAATPAWFASVAQLFRPVLGLIAATAGIIVLFRLGVWG